VTLRFERRAFRRVGSGRCHGVTGLRVRPGCEASLLDLSCGGLLLETESRLSPGSAVDVLLKTFAATHVVRARVARCQVASIHPLQGLRFRAAVVFERPLRDAHSWQEPWADATQLPTVATGTE
jgi:hypothetical protein